MIYLLYASTAVREFSESELDALVATSREKNSKHGITSMLLYKNGNIIQMLEGKDDTVRELFEIIGKDPRHHEIVKISEGHLAERAFAKWPMGFMNLDRQEIKSHPCFSKIMNHPLFDSDENPECVACLEMLKEFIGNVE